MTFGGHRLLVQLGAGKDGIAYRAEAPDGGGPVEVRVLGGARADSLRWPSLSRRLQRAALLNHPAAVGIRTLDLTSDPPFVVMEWVERTSLADVLSNRLPLPTAEALALAHELADLLAAAHRIGLVHGRVSPDAVLWTGENHLKLDFTGTAVRSAFDPETADGTDPAADVSALGELLCWLLTERGGAGQTEFVPPSGLAPSLSRLIQDLLAADPAERPSAREAANRLRAFHSPPEDTQAVNTDLGGPNLARTSEAPGIRDEAPMPERLGRFRLLEKLGKGGMGTVFRAEDTSDGTIVAIKVPHADLAANPTALRRFFKEARLLAEVNNPYVTNLLEVNADQGFHYLVLEYVAGRGLNRYLAERGQLDEREALTILADVARALVEAHERGIVHRDVKPENVLLEKGNAEEGRWKEEGAFPFRVKLSDFGLARHVIESESLNVTRAGAVMGTPLYVAPEQGAGLPVDARADVYSMGATLFHLLAGRPPFRADSLLGLIALHQNEAPPPLRKFNPAVSDGVCRVVEKALAKSPDARYPNAGTLLHDLERLLRGEPTSISIHPRRPECDPRNVVRYEWVWELESPPARLWPYVSNTERLNRAVGLTAVQFATRSAGEEGGSRIEDRGSKPSDAPSSPRPGVRRFGQFRKAGLAVAWEEHPFEWVEARRMGVLREYSQGPFKWLMSVVELAPRGGGTTLTHRVEIEPRGFLGRTIAAVEVGVRSRRSVERVYRRIDAALTGKAASPHGRGLVDPFEEPAELSRAQRKQLDRLLDDLVARGVDPGVAEALADFVAHAPPQEVARLRPLALAGRLGLDPQAVVAACLQGVRAGLLVLLWDVLCPVCRIPTEIKDTLRQLREHGRCEVCNLDFTLDFANSVELIFRAHPEVRASELGTYCIGGPAHSPHVVAQARVAPGERIELDLALTEGSYRLRGPQLPYNVDFRVQPGAGVPRWEIQLARGPDPGLPRVLRLGGQTLALTNDHSEELVVRVERTAPRADALTAARASSLALFRELFPDEILSPGQLVSVATMTLLVTDLDGADHLYAESSDAKAFAVLHEHFRLLGDRIRAEGGAVVKTVGEGLVAAFQDPLAAVRAGLELQEVLARKEATRGLGLRAGIHRGPVQAATLNDQLDYFGTTVRQALALPALARGGELVLTQAVTGDPQVAALLGSAGVPGELFEAALPGGSAFLLQRLTLRPG